MASRREYVERLLEIADRFDELRAELDALPSLSERKSSLTRPGLPPFDLAGGAGVDPHHIRRAAHSILEGDFTGAPKEPERRIARWLLSYANGLEGGGADETG